MGERRLKEPQLHLTDAEISAILSIWSEESRAIKSLSVRVFTKYFTGYPQHLKKFRAFGKSPIAQLPTNTAFQAHAYSVFCALAAILGTLDDVNTAKEMLKRLGERHARRWVRPEDVRNFCYILVQEMEADVGLKWTIDATTGWGKLMAFVDEMMRLGMMEAVGI